MSWRNKFRLRRRGGDGFNSYDRDTLVLMLEGIYEMTDIVTRLKSDVEEQTTVINSVVLLLQGLAARVRDANNNDDSEALDEIASELEANSVTLGQAVAANTPADDTTSTTSSSDSGGQSEAQPTPQSSTDTATTDGGSSDSAQEQTVIGAGGETQSPTSSDSTDTGPTE